MAVEVGAHGACMQDLGLWIRIFSVLSAILCEILSIANRREVNHGGLLVLCKAMPRVTEG